MIVINQWGVFSDAPPAERAKTFDYLYNKLN